MADGSKTHDLDKGYAWVIAAASFLTYFITMGLSYTVGIFYTIIYNNLDINSHKTVAIAPSVFNGMFYGTGIYSCFFCT